MNPTTDIPYGKQDITSEDIAAVIEVLKSNFLTQGPKVKEFEEAFAKYIGSKYAVAVANGTAALHLSTLALDVQPGQKVITTPNTFVASANSVLYCGGEIEFADIDSKNYCLDPNKVEDLLKKNPQGYKGIIPVDFAGYPVNMEDFKVLADRYGLWIIEDACHAPGASFKDSKGILQRSGNGAYSDLSIFSFHPVKHIACGEGGMITTNNYEFYQKLLLLRTHGISKDPTMMSRQEGGWYYEMQTLGFNYRIPDMLCALGTSQLKRVEKSLERRWEIVSRYEAELSGLPIKLPAKDKDVVHAYHLFVVLIEQRKALYDYLKKENIFAQVHYIPVHQQPYYVNRYGAQKFDVADKYYEQCLSLPVFQSMKEDEQSKVIEKIKAFFK